MPQARFWRIFIQSKNINDSEKDDKSFRDPMHRTSQASGDEVLWMQSEIKAVLCLESKRAERLFIAPIIAIMMLSS